MTTEDNTNETLPFRREDEISTVSPEEMTVPHENSPADLASDDSSASEQDSPHTPPQNIPEYFFEEFLGSGAYGEVWKARELNTGRYVAIKVYTHKKILDSSLIAQLSQEVEKLSFLFSDRYVVQLLSVGWDATPPYYVMEYMDHGSLSEEIHKRTFNVDEAVHLLQEIATGVYHAHQKEVVHCDLKPGNILLDQDGRPRLADFGQSRLSHDMTPALGTLFYMAPEQANLNVTPDIRWDIYALGAIFYTMLMGHPPHYDLELVEKIHSHKKLTRKLREYRETLLHLPVPVDYRIIPGINSHLVGIMEKCLHPDPEERFQNVGELLNAITAYKKHRALKPLVMLGGITPLILLLMVTIFVAWAFKTTTQDGKKALITSALRSNRFAADFAAKTANYELLRRIDAVERLAQDPLFRETVEYAIHSSPWKEITDHLLDPTLSPQEYAKWQERFIQLPQRERIQKVVEYLLPKDFRPAEYEGDALEVATVSPVKRLQNLEISLLDQAIVDKISKDKEKTEGQENSPEEITSDISDVTPAAPTDISEDTPTNLPEKTDPQTLQLSTESEAENIIINDASTSDSSEDSVTEKPSSENTGTETNSSPKEISVENTDETAVFLPSRIKTDPDVMRGIQKNIKKLLPDTSRRLREDVASWAFLDYRGISTARIPFAVTVGNDFAWASFFTGKKESEKPGWRPAENEHLQKFHISPPYRSPISGEWVVTVAAPVFSMDESEHFLGVLSMTVGIGRFINKQDSTKQFSVLVDNRPGKRQGLILQHPLYDSLVAGGKPVPSEFLDSKFHVDIQQLQNITKSLREGKSSIFYTDPLSKTDYGKPYDKRWLVEYKSIDLGNGEEWLVVVQESYDDSVACVLHTMEAQVLRISMISLGAFLTVLFTMWYFARRETQFIT
ncbi:MAG: serine/threonine protein kinase [Planctomycetia bacterium]|nr:serine/threonine protein kinase [Planctomycetia bacterium]